MAKITVINNRHTGNIHFLGSQEPDDTCVVLISNLPEKGYSVEEIFNLAKPFGGLRDVLILSSHKKVSNWGLFLPRETTNVFLTRLWDYNAASVGVRCFWWVTYCCNTLFSVFWKAYLEINRKSADSMVKFYTCFAISLDGNQLCINMVPQYKTIKDEVSNKIDCSSRIRSNISMQSRIWYLSWLLYPAWFIYFDGLSCWRPVLLNVFLGPGLWIQQRRPKCWRCN